MFKTSSSIFFVAVYLPTSDELGTQTEPNVLAFIGNIYMDSREVRIRLGEAERLNWSHMSNN